MSIHLTSKISQGTNPIYVGNILNEPFAGTSLDGAIWSTALPTGATVNNSLIVTSGLSNWSRYIQLAKLYIYEKQEQVIEWTAVTKNSGDGWGIATSPILIFSNTILYLKFDQSNGANSGCITMGIGDTTALNAGISQPIAFSAGDHLRLTITRTQRKTVTVVENLTTPTNPKAYGEFDNAITGSIIAAANWGTQGYMRLSFLGGQQTFTKYSIISHAQNFNGLRGTIFYGDSITSGYGASSNDRRFTDIAMRGQTHLFENVGLGGWTTDDLNSYLVGEVDNLINAKYAVVNIGFNNANQATGTSAFSTSLTTLVTTLQAHGRIVILVSLFPSITIDNKPYSDVIAAVATAKSCKFVDIAAQLRIAGNLINGTYISPDAIHPNDEGHAAMGAYIAQQCPELYRDIITDINNDDFRFNNLPTGLNNQEIITIGTDGRVCKTPRRLINTDANSYVRLFSTTFAAQAGSFWIAGNGKFQGNIQAYTGMIGFNDGVNNDRTNANLNITNAGVGGIGTPQAFDTFTGSAGNIKIIASSDSKRKQAMASTITGDNNTLLNGVCGITLSGSWNTMINAAASGITTGSNNIGIGQAALSGITTGSSNVHLNAIGTSTASTSALSNTILIGDLTSYDAYVNNDIAFSTGPFVTSQIYLGSKGGGGANLRFPSTTNPTTNGAVVDAVIATGRGAGAALPGTLYFQTWTPIASGTAYHSTAINKIRFDYMGIGVGTATVTASAADALLDLQSTTQGFLPPRMTTTQRDLLATGVLTIVATAGGTGYTNGNVALTFSGGAGSGVAAYVKIIAGSVSSTHLTARGINYTSAPTPALTSGGGSGATFTVTIGATEGSIIYNLTTHKLNVWTGSAWEVITSV